MLTTTALQLFLLIGPGLALAAVMHVVAELTTRRAQALVGTRGSLALFGWLGTIVHEAAHALFCVLFRHRITSITWFDPSARSGALGAVTHTYDRGSLYQRIGNFFIGIGPIIVGSLLIYGASRLLLGSHVFAPMMPMMRSSSPSGVDGGLDAARAIAMQVGDGIVGVARPTLTGAQLRGWRLYAFLYLALSIGSALRLSAADLAGAAVGLIALTAALVAFNAATLWIGEFAASARMAAAHANAVFCAVIAFAILVNVAMAGVLFVVSVVGGWVRRR